jgi:hypothetical protein
MFRGPLGLALAIAITLLAGQANAAILIAHGDDPQNPDGRGSIVTIGAKLGLSPGEIAQARRATGFIFCPGPDYDENKIVTASAALVVTGDQIVTNAHVFADVIAKQGRTGLDYCVFRNQQGDANFQQVPIAPASLLMTDAGPISAPDHESRDFALVRLKWPVAGARPFGIAPGRWSVAAGETILSIAAMHVGMRRPVPLTQPVVEDCTVLSVYAATANGASHYHTDCDVGGGASGSLNLVRDDEGQLVIIGIFSGSAAPSEGVYAVDESLNRRSLSIGFDGALREAAEAMAAPASPGATSAGAAMLVDFTP